MEYRPLELNVISAKDIHNVNLFGKMDVYVVVTIAGDPRMNQKSPVDKNSGTKPTWNFQMKFDIDEAAAQNGGLTLVFYLRCARRFFGHKDIGQVYVPIRELLNNAGDGNSVKFISYQVRKSSGRPKGQLNFSYKFGDIITAPVPDVSKGDEPVTAYPAAAGMSPAYPPPGFTGPPPGFSGYSPPPQGGYLPPPGYPPAVAGYGYPPHGFYQPPRPGYGHPSAPGYGYPPASGYGYPPTQQPEPPKKNKFGMGLGAGLLGGLLIGDMVSDAAEF